MKKSLLALMLFVSQLANASINEMDKLDWHLEKVKGDIKILSADVPESQYDAYMAITVVKARTEDLVEIIRNPSTCTEWVFRCGKSYRYAQESANVDLVYTSSKMPFPLKDRDTLARITWNEDPETKVVRAIGRATSDILTPSKGYIRINNATVVWELTPLSNGTTEVKTYGHADPGGEVPSWLTNQFTTLVPVETLTRLKKLLAANS